MSAVKKQRIDLRLTDDDKSMKSDNDKWKKLCILSSGNAHYL